MSYFKTKKKFSFRDLLYKALIFAGTVAVIVYFLPRDGKFNYQFDIDKPWKIWTADGHFRLSHL